MSKAKIPCEQTLVQHTNQTYWQHAQLNDKNSLSMKDSVSISKQSLQITQERKKILNYWSIKAVTVLNSTKNEL